MKILKFGLRAWLTMASVLSFVGGWILLAHSPKPITVKSDGTMAVSTLEPLSPLGDFSVSNDSIQNQSLLSIQPRPRSFFRTSGS